LYKWKGWAMEENKKLYKRLGIDMRIDMHAQVKAAAALRNISMNLLVHKALYNYLKRSDDMPTKKLN